MSESTPSHLLVGTVRRAVGLRGEVEIVVVSDDPSRFKVGAVVLAGERLRELTIATSRMHNDRTIVSFDGVDNRDASEAMVGTEFFIPITEARSLSGGEFWDHQLIGCVVKTVAGIVVGSVSAVIHPPGNDILEVQSESGAEHLIPLVAAIVTSVDADRRLILIDPPDGLLG